MDESLKKYLAPEKVFKPVPTGLAGRGTVMHGIKALIFDIYGTLLISASGDVGCASAAGSEGAFTEALSLCGISGVSVIPDEAGSLMKRLYFDAIADTHKALRAEGYPSPEVDIVQIWSELLCNDDLNSLIPGLSRLEPVTAAAAYESTVNPVYPMPGMFELFKHPLVLSTELGIISNAQFYTPLIFDCLLEGGLAALGFDPDLCLFSYIEKRSKPDLKLFDNLSNKLASRGIKPSEAVFIGNDMLNDIMPAALSGYRTVLFAGDKRSLRLRNDHHACKDIKPDVIVNNLIDIIDYIQEG